MTRRHVSVAVAGAMLALAGAGHDLAAQTARTVIDVSAGRHILLVLSDGSVWGGIDGSYGRLGREQDVQNAAPFRRIALPSKALQVAASGATSYALLDDGTVWAWGRGDSGEFGMALPPGGFRATPAAVPGLSGVKKITSNRLALMTDGTVRAWGQMPRQFTGTDSNLSLQPVTVPGVADAVDIAGTAGLGIAITRAGRAIAWDLMDHPYLLPGGKEIAPAPPAEVPGLRDVVSAAVVFSTTAVVTSDGSVWTWGHNGQAGLGNGTRASGPGAPPQFAPARATGVVRAVSVKGGDRHYLVLRADGTLIGWGNTDWGQLGSGLTAQFQPTPTAVKLPNVAAFWASGDYSFARTSDGAFWFWGKREGAAALLGATRNIAVPTKVALTSVLSEP